MITHTSKETPPEVPMITGVTPNRPARRSIDETVASTVAAVVKGMGAAQPLQAQVQHSVSAAHLISLVSKIQHLWPVSQNLSHILKTVD